MRFETGQTVVRRGVHPDGQVGACACGRVVSDDERGLLMWISADSDFVQPTTLDVRPAGTLPSLRTWHADGGGALVLTPLQARHSVLWFFDAAGDFTGWYVNLEKPAVRWFGGVDIRDQALDVLVAPDLSWQWKDEDEFAERTGRPLSWDHAEAAVIRSEGERMIALAEAGRFPFNGAWCDFRPDPAWPPSTLPGWWDQTPD